jgi:hypothetical protein
MQVVHPYRLYTNVPRWFIASTSGTVTTSGITITFTIDPSANHLRPNTYVNSINFTINN